MTKKSSKILYISNKPDSIDFQGWLTKEDEVVIARNTSEAFSFLASAGISIIIFDWEAEDNDPVSFFEQVRIKYPRPVRILISASYNSLFLINAINHASLFKFIKKPFTGSEIRNAVMEAKEVCIDHSEIIDKYNELEKSYDKLDKYAYSVTHDLRRPLLSILGAVEAAQSMDNIMDLRRMLAMMEDSVKNMDTFIHNIHEYYKLKHGALQFEEIDFNEIVKNQKRIYQMAAETDNIQFLSSVKQSMPFRNDRMAITLILNNLLSNAIKYQRKGNPAKQIEVNVHVLKKMVVISVKDNGIGIAGKHIPEIFNMFFRVNSEEIGSGVGLYTVKDTLLKLNGNIEVESVVDKGTTFTVTIPGK